MEILTEKTYYITLDGLTRSQTAFILDRIEKMPEDYGRVVDAPNSSPHMEAIEVEYDIFQDEINELRAKVKAALIKADTKVFYEKSYEEIVAK